MNELMVLQNKLESATASPAVINFPVAEAKALVTEYMKKYENVAYSDDVIKQVKEDKKELNKVKKSINDFGIKTDKELSANIKAFRNDLKDLIAMIDEPMDRIDAAITDFEDRRKMEKKLNVTNLIEDRIRKSELEEKFAAKVELKEQYLNVSFTMKQVDDDVMGQIANAKAEQDKYHLQVSQIEQQVEMSNMRHGLNVELKASTFLSMLNYRQFDEIKALIEKQADEQKQSENAFAERIKAEEQAKAAVQMVEQVQAITESIEKIVPVETAGEKILTVTLKISTTKGKMDALKAYMDTYEIGYTKA